MNAAKFQEMREAVIQGIASGLIIKTDSQLIDGATRKQAQDHIAAQKQYKTKPKTIPRVCECGATFFVRWPSDKQRICGHKCANSRKIERKLPKRRQVTAGRKAKALGFGDPVL